MATTAFTPTAVAGSVVSFATKTQKGNTTKLVCIRGLNGYGGLKVHNSVASLGMPVCTPQCFAMVVSSLKNGKGRRGGGALSAKCSKVAEIFQIAAIMNGLVLIGVAIGFALLRFEAAVEDADL